MAAHTLNADFESDARAQRWLLKNQRQKFAAQCFGVARRIGFDVRSDREQLSRMRRAPFRSGKEIVGFLRRNCQCSRCHFHLETDVATLATSDGAFSSEDSAAGATRGV